MLGLNLFTTGIKQKSWHLHWNHTHLYHIKMQLINKKKVQQKDVTWSNPLKLMCTWVCLHTLLASPTTFFSISLQVQHTKKLIHQWTQDPAIAKRTQSCISSANSSLYISSIIGFHSRTRALMNQFDIWSSNNS